MIRTYYFTLDGVKDGIGLEEMDRNSLVKKPRLLWTKEDVNGVGVGKWAGYGRHLKVRTNKTW